MSNIEGFGVTKIDSAKFYFDRDIFKSVSIPEKFILTDADSGEIIEEFKKNSLSLPFEGHKVYISNVVKQLTSSKNTILYEKVMVYFSPKIRGNEYFKGIDLLTLREVLYFLRSRGYLDFNTNNLTRIIENCYLKDCDMRIDFVLPKDSGEDVEDYYKCLKDRFNGNPGNFRHFANKKKEGHGIVVNNRNNGGIKNPFFKFYDKGLELKTEKNREFYDNFNDDIKEFLRQNYILRFEYQIKDNRMFKYYGLSNKFVDIIKVPQSKWEYIRKSILHKVFTPQTRVIDKSKMVIADRNHVILINHLLFTGLTFGAIQQLYLKSAHTKYEKYKFKKKFYRWYQLATDKSSYTKEAHAIIERIAKFDKIVGL